MAKPVTASTGFPRKIDDSELRKLDPEDKKIIWLLLILILLLSYMVYAGFGWMALIALFLALFAK